MDVSIADYEAVLRLSEERHFGRAAERLGVSQPSLTARLRRIEEKVGARLFERSRTQVILTAVGETFCDVGYDVVATSYKAERTVLDAAVGVAELCR